MLSTMGMPAWGNLKVNFARHRAAQNIGDEHLGMIALVVHRQIPGVIKKVVVGERFHHIAIGIEDQGEILDPPHHCCWADCPR